MPNIFTLYSGVMISGIVLFLKLMTLNIYETYRARTTLTPPILLPNGVPINISILLRLYYAMSYMYRCCDGISFKGIADC